MHSDREIEKRKMIALESIADSLKVIPNAGEWLESCTNRIELKLQQVSLNLEAINRSISTLEDRTVHALDMGLTSIEMTITRSRQG